MGLGRSTPAFPCQRDRLAAELELHSPTRNSNKHTAGARAKLDARSELPAVGLERIGDSGNQASLLRTHLPLQMQPKEDAASLP